MVPGGQGGKSFNYTVQCTASSQPVFRIYCTVYTEGILLQNQLFVVGIKVRGRFGECAFCAFGRFAETVAAQKAVLLPPGPLASRAFCKTAALPEFHLMDRCTG